MNLIDKMLRKDREESFLPSGKRQEETVINDIAHRHNFVEHDFSVSDVDKDNWFCTYHSHQRCSCGAERHTKTRGLI